MSIPTNGTSAQSRLSSKVSQAQYAPPQARPASDPVLANIVARLKAEVSQSSGSRGDRRPVPGQFQHVGQQQVKAVFDPFSRYHIKEKEDLMKHSPFRSKAEKTIPGNTTTTCICNRPRQLVMCQHCGETFEGRVKLICPSHPSVTYLLDVVACRGCKMDDVEALKEFPITKC